MHRTISPEAGDALQSVARVRRTPSLNRPQPAGKKFKRERVIERVIEKRGKQASKRRTSTPRCVAASRCSWRATTLPTPTKSTLSASDDAWRCQAPASCQSLDQQACATARSRSSRCMALSYLLLLVPKCVPWPTPVHTHRAAVGAARALLQVFRSLAAVCSPSIVAFDFGFSDRSFSATLCEKIIHLITTSRVYKTELTY